MNNLFLRISILIVSFIGLISGAFGQNRLSESDSLLKWKNYYSRYIDKPVYEFLLDDSIRNYKHISLSAEPPGMLNSAGITKNKKEYIQIFVCKYEYLTEFNELQKWDLNLYYKEKICRILFYKDDIIVLDIKQTGLR